MAKEGLNSNKQYTLRLEHEKNCKISTEILMCLKMCQNFKAWLWGAVAHSPRRKIHNIKPTEGNYHHLEGLWDWSTYNRFRGMITMPTNCETPCMSIF